MTHDTPTPPPPPSPDDGEAERLLGLGLSQGGGRTPPPTPEALAAQFPQFEILEVLGQGGMGVVYKARQRKLDRLVALKVLPRALGEDPAFAERFAREGRTLARLQHPHIVGVHDIGEADGQWYLVMEYVDGVNLRTLMETGELTPTEALAIVPQICEALQYAHDEGVVHRDIKPENVLLDRSGSVKVADFGLAKLVQRTPEEFTLTGTDQVMGTLHYMAPEQYRTPQDVDHRADIFSLGVVFYEMLTGELPVGRFAEPSKSGALDARIDEIVMRALEREREARFQQAREVATAVTGVAQGASAVPAATGTPTGAPTRAAAPPSPPPPGRLRWSRWATTATVLYLLTPVVGGLALLWANLALDEKRAMAMDGMVAWIVTLIGLGVTALFAITATAVTWSCQGRVRGQWLATGILGLTLVSAVVGFVGLDHEVRTFQHWHREHPEWFGPASRRDLPPPRPAATDPRPAATEAQVRAEAERKAIAEVLHGFDHVARPPEGVAFADLRLHGLYAADDLDRIAALPAEALAKGRMEGSFGLGLWRNPVVLRRWSHYAFGSADFGSDWDTATVTVSYQLQPRISDAWDDQDTTRGPRRLTFPMKRDGERWVFAIGQVRIR